jgi:hypothetical protein
MQCKELGYDAGESPAMTENHFDVIGDIHGHADALRNLLHKVDYREHDGVFRHASRRVIFVGDFIDRGPQQLTIVRDFESESAANPAQPSEIDFWSALPSDSVVQEHTNRSEKIRAGRKGYGTSGARP